MIRSLSAFVLSVSMLLAVGCSKREKSDPNAEEWSDIHALADDADVEMAAGDSGSATTASPAGEGSEEFGAFERRLQEMKAATRGSGQTLLTGDKLVFDYQERFVRMDGDVIVEDDEGTLKTDRLVGRFSESNQVEHVEASGGVSFVSGDRSAHADSAVYNYVSGLVQLDGQASASEAGNRLSGERIRFWTRGDRRMLCEPNAMLVVSGDSAFGTEGVPDGGETEIRANRIVYDEVRRQVDLTGQVKLRDSRAAMDCGEVHLFLKDNNKIDWIDAASEVIIQAEDRKALAERATYVADEGKFTLEGSPKVMQGRNVMTGDRIIFWHETRRMVCEPNARVLLYLDEATKAKFLKDLND